MSKKTEKTKERYENKIPRKKPIENELVQKELNEKIKTEDLIVCQNCKWHNNRPSFCRLNKNYINRKSACEKFERIIKNGKYIKSYS